MRALISCYDKGGLDEFARGLAELGCELVASGGTASHLDDLGLAVTRVEAVTGFAEMLGHRVVTLHPAVHGGILARRDRADDLADLAEHEIKPFDLVVVNLYPFTEVASRFGVKEEEAVEMIDIGGPALLRAAAKNFAHVGAVARPERYESVLSELQEQGELTLDTRRSLAAEAFVVTAAYESAIAQWFSDRESVPGGADSDVLEGTEPLVRGEPAPARRLLRGGRRASAPAVAGRAAPGEGALVQQPQRPLGGARQLVEEFTLPACVIVKHSNPCGVAVAGGIEEAYARALGSDPVSAYGGVVVLNRPVDAALAARLAEQFIEVLFAPGVRRREPSSLCAPRSRCVSLLRPNGAMRRPASATCAA